MIIVGAICCYLYANGYLNFVGRALWGAHGPPRPRLRLPVQTPPSEQQPEVLEVAEDRQGADRGVDGAEAAAEDGAAVAQRDAAVGTCAVKVRGQNGSELHFQIKRTSQMKRLMDVYKQRQGGTYRFSFEGTHIAETQTPDDVRRQPNRCCTPYLAVYVPAH